MKYKSRRVTVLIAHAVVLFTALLLRPVGQFRHAREGKKGLSAGGLFGCGGPNHQLPSHALLRASGRKLFSNGVQLSYSDYVVVPCFNHTVLTVVRFEKDSECGSCTQGIASYGWKSGQRDAVPGTENLHRGESRMRVTAADGTRP